MDWADALASQLPSIVLLLVVIGCLVAVIKLAVPGAPRTFGAVGFGVIILAEVTGLVGQVIGLALMGQGGQLASVALVTGLSSGIATILIAVGFILVTVALVVGHKQPRAAAPAPGTESRRASRKQARGADGSDPRA
ncbi:hypothetical protein ACF3NT_14370 [Naumannella halotolerans]|uniref:hypothetical protein n=1 Tax=Naumannella halotolerans TaxID=993414 RepID=UPI00370DBD57